MDTPAERPLSGADFIRQFFPSSPYVAHLGMQLTDIQPGTATITLPFADPLITIGTIVHGGAIASLIDTAAWLPPGRMQRFPRKRVVRLSISALPTWLRQRKRTCRPLHACCAVAAAWSISMSRSEVPQGVPLPEDLSPISWANMAVK